MFCASLKNIMVFGVMNLIFRKSNKNIRVIDLHLTVTVIRGLKNYVTIKPK